LQRITSSRTSCKSLATALRARARGLMARGSHASCDASESTSSRSTDRTDRPDGTRARPTPWTRSRPLERRCRGTRRATRSPVTGPPRPSERSSSPKSLRASRGSRPSSRCSTSSSAPQRRFTGLKVPALIKECAALRPARSPDTVTAATKSSLSSLAHRIQFPEVELAALDEQIAALVAAAAPELWHSSDSAPTRRPLSSSQLATTPSDSAPRPPGRGCAGSHRNGLVKGRRSLPTRQRR
jgi:hypothetical protein